MRARGDLRGSGGCWSLDRAAGRRAAGRNILSLLFVVPLLLVCQSALGVGSYPDEPAKPKPDDAGEPLLIVSKWAGEATHESDGTYQVPFKIRVENRGAIKIYDLQLEDAVARNISPALVLGIDGLEIAGDVIRLDRTFDGEHQTRLLTPGQYLKPGQSVTVRFLLRFDAQGNAGPFWNRATGSGRQDSGEPVIDYCIGSSVAGPIQANNEISCEPAEIKLPEVSGPPVIGLAKDMSEPVVLEDGSLETRIQFVVENFGDGALTSVQITDDLRETFGESAFSVVGGSVESPQFAVNGGFDGVESTNLLATGAELPTGELGTVSLRVRFSPAEGVSAIQNQAVAMADGTEDLSTAGSDPDPNGDGVPDEQEITVAGWSPPSPPVLALGLANEAIEGPRQDDGRFSTTLLHTAENLGEVPVTELRIENLLSTTFIGTAAFEVAPGSIRGDVPVNPDFDGLSQTNLLGQGVQLAPGEQFTIQVSVLFDPGEESSPFYNQASIQAVAPSSGATVEDLSTRGTDPDPDGDGDPLEAEPTPIPFERGTASAELIKQVGDIQAQDGGYRVPFFLTLNNTGDLTLKDLQVEDDLRAAFPAPVGVSVIEGPVVGGALMLANPNFSVADPRLLSGTESLAPGASASINFVVFVELNGAEGPFFNQAVVTGFDPSGEVVVDLSDDGDGGDSGGGDGGDSGGGDGGDSGGGDGGDSGGGDGGDSGGGDGDDDPTPVIMPGLGEGELVVQHQVDRRRAVIGDVVGYTGSVENRTSETIESVSLTLIPPAGLILIDESIRIRRPGLDGRFDSPDDRIDRVDVSTDVRVQVPLGDLPAGERCRVEYGARITPGATPGVKISKVTGAVADEVADDAVASLLIEADPLTSETTIIGKVFHDLDDDGFQGENEPGIPGARLVTLDGLIVETDEAGRYHIAAVDTGRADRGGNFMIKLDSLSLPQNVLAARSERRVVRLTPGLMTRINFAVPSNPNYEVRDDSGFENRTDPFRFDPKLDILALDQLQRVDSASTVDAQFAVYSNYHRYIRRYEISFFDVSDSRFVQRLHPQQPDVEGELPSELPSRRTDKLKLENWLRVAPAYTVRVNDPERDLFIETIPLPLTPKVTRIAYRITAFGDCDPIRGEPMDRTALRILDVVEGDGDTSLNREASEIFGHSNLAMQNIIVRGDRNLAGRAVGLGAGMPLLTEEIEPFPLPRDPRLAGELLNATYGLVQPEKPIWREREMTVEDEKTWAVFDHEGLAAKQQGYVEFEPERIVHAAKSDYVPYDEHASGLHSVILTCGCSRVSAETIIDAKSEGMSLKLTNLGNLPERPIVSIDEGKSFSLAPMVPRSSQELFLGHFGDGAIDGMSRTNPHWQTIEVALGAVDQGGDRPQFRLKRWVRDGEYGPELEAICEGVSARPHTTKPENLLASMVVTDERKVEPPSPVRDPFFSMGLINLTLGSNDVSGQIEALADDGHYDEDIFVDGRIAGYLKGRILGKYLITGQIDTTEAELKNLGEALTAKDPQRMFRQLDPDRYYPVYGDDSTTFSDVNSQGNMFLRVDWDKSTALWGNYNTGLTGTEFSQFNRSLYGAKLDYRSNGSNRFGEDSFSLKVFGSEALTASAHATFRATGGSLYYLPHRDIVQGSEKLWIEIRARDSEQVLETEVLLPGRDYEVDDLQGRIILARPLSHIVRERADPIIRTTSLSGDRVFLQVDYEHLPVEFAAGDLTTGARGQWAGDRLSVGLTSVSEEREGTDYELLGTDVSYRFAERSHIRAEYARSEANLNDLQAASLDGGLSFTDQQVEEDLAEGDAWGVEMLLDIGELNPPDDDDASPGETASLQKLIEERVSGELRAWHKEKDAGFSAGRIGESSAYTDTGFSVDGRINDRLALGGGAVRVDTGDRRRSIVRVQSETDLACNAGRCLSLGIEGRYEDLEADESLIRPGREGEALLIGARLGREFTGGTSVYASAQATVDQDERYEDNDRFVLGVNQRMTERLALSLEGSDGDRGSAVVGGLEWAADGGVAVNLSGGIGSGATTQFGTRYTIADGIEVYGTHTIDPDRTDGARNLTTLGQRSQLGSRTSVFTETTFGRDRGYADTAHTFGLNHDIDENWLLGASIQSSSLEAGDLDVKREAYSLGASRRSEFFRLSSRLEYRRDSGSGLDTRQYLTSNRIGFSEPDSAWRYMGKLNLAWTDNRADAIEDGRFVELNLGAAYRPLDEDRWNTLAKYTYLYDVGSNGQLGRGGRGMGADLEEKSHVISVETLREVTRELELGGKVTAKLGEQRLRSSGSWYDSRLLFTAVRARYRLPIRESQTLESAWEVLAEYRLLKDFEANGVRHGALAGLYWSTRNSQFKVGVGYNFTDFDSDLRGSGYRSGGWFVDLIAAY